MRAAPGRQRPAGDSAGTRAGAGGRAGRLGVDGYEFDTGPTVLTMPDLIAEALGAVGEELTDWLDLTPLDPAYRAYYPDGSTLDVITPTPPDGRRDRPRLRSREADGYLRFVDYARNLWQWERADFIERNLDAPTDLLTGNLLKLFANGAFRRLQTKINQFFRDPRTQRIFSFQAMYAGLSPHDALAIYTVIAYSTRWPGSASRAAASTRSRVGWRRGREARRADPVRHHGDPGGDRQRPRHRRRHRDGDFIPADTVVLNPDLPVAYQDLLPPSRQRKLTYSPSCVVLHIGSTQGYGKIAHHNIHFGRSWKGTFDEVIRRGELMSDPSLLVTNPSRTDPSVAPAGKHTYYVLAPVPKPGTGAVRLAGDLTQRYAEQLVTTLEERGYVGFGDGIEVMRPVTPADWAAQGMAAGTPFAAAHSLFQTGPFRPSNLHRTLENVVFVGSGTQPGVGVPMVLISGKIAAARITGAMP
ncbi:phytoene desaturase family protein [Micromonospora sp. b486]|uniref:phytoene desaturase family protein n=1 Tax=Micromonospora sp. b486 TaxID=3053986 RepID=UPI00259CFEC0|nr:phytoene desaturase family protein [Micromonospora sp. b486]MDM4784693.1 phytoene desaturase family protein [Micromonospora sp. b486]